ncbi:DUF4179 domain-containing protein [Heyndrickxia sporothermodurans]|uniref:DUF4179 domain-containing protein n=5 Tax=Heyndrickxia sporothermodurans TaxID=46224 RepID=A0A150KLT8_9BACI|nr:DUF4179 domain-containing protein [Heyndrickxia sporothermodurans]KYC95151.1 hypothetical protein B4102_1422 [Heyndrickxia sporothermodurans]MBL5768712.1 DUF4179 domain-containing protein [Heyndrickxia sporothermodurans]MBL5772430.1 DUF4179 domain-containing protein [Heyndrickxia sporothermodurans]MBL5776448.1 DUF4179 domain-containing protein [Heyndrickxia sporothermodurans]MBL5779484.1 DUF4179 domain-containing protein [Heyndrickxia sporothermodurans]
MFEKEEKQLQSVKQEIDTATIPEEQLNQAIFTGIQKAKRRKKHYSLWKKTIILAASFIIIFLGSIRVSDTFASYIKKIPGMEHIVELVQDNKGLLAAVDNEYFQKVNRSDEHHGFKVTLDSIITDEEQLVVFYSFKSSKKLPKQVWSKDVYIEKENGEKLKTGSSSCCGGDRRNQYETSISDGTFEFAEPIPKGKLTLVMKFEKYNEEWRIPFSIDQNKIGKKKTIPMKKTVTVENQQILIDHITFSPTRVGINVKFPTQNSKEIFDIQDLRFVDENGEAWSKIQNGIVAHGGNDEKTYFLQSNYFEQPKKLFLVFNKIRALDKDELNVVIDPFKKKIIQAPKDGQLHKVEFGAFDDSTDLLMFYLNEKFNGQIFDSYTDFTGKMHRLSTYIWEADGEKIGFPYKINNAISKKPITLKLIDYPAYINTDVKIQIK